jgi:hypothetical protein
MVYGAGDTGIASRKQTRPPRAERVLAALQHFARGAIVCELPSTIARSLGVSVDTVHRGISDLLRDGRLERTPLQPQGKATAYRLVASPQLEVESPQQSTALSTAAARPPKGAAAARSDDRKTDPDLFEKGPPETPKKPWNQSPMSEADRVHLDNFEWSPELLTEYAARAREVAERYSGVDRIEGLVAATAGVCDDCHQDKPRRRYGSFTLCTVCSIRRLIARMRVGAAVAEAERFPIPNERDDLRPMKAPQEVRWRAA